MKCYFISISLALLLLFSVCSSSKTPPPSINATAHESLLSENLKSIRDYLKKINKPAVKTIHSPDGDLIDCVLFHLQPAFDHPLLKDYKPTLTPPELPKGFLPNNNMNDNSSASEEVFQQVWRLLGESCPENAVPIRRITEEEVLRAGSVQGYLRDRNPKYGGRVVQAKATSGSTVHGADAGITVWSHPVETNGEYSTMQLWVKNSGREVLEAGFKISSGPDHQPRLFIHWTNDGFNNTGCFDLRCPGFIQKPSTPLAIGSAISPTSTYGRNYQEMRFTLWRDDSNKKRRWWLRVNNAYIGYWPYRLFPGLTNKGADTVEFGGEVLDLGRPPTRTFTKMGSGHFAGEGYHKAAMIRNLGVVNSSGFLVRPPNLFATARRPACYDAKVSNGRGNLEPLVYYGGPGRAAKNCR